MDDKKESNKVSLDDYRSDSDLLNCATRRLGSFETKKATQKIIAVIFDTDTEYTFSQIDPDLTYMQVSYMLSVLQNRFAEMQRS